MSVVSDREVYFVFILYIIFIGFIVGLIARAVMPGRDPGGLIITTLLGVGGAVVASYLGGFFGFYGEGHAAGFLAAVLGAMLLLLGYRLLRRRGL